MSIHTCVIDTIRASNSAAPKPAATNIMTVTNNEAIRMMFSNVRGIGEDRRGLQLTQGGLAIMSSFFRSYPVVFANQQIFSARHILFLDRACSMPWYADSFLPITVTFFEAGLAMRAKLVGDLDVFMNAFSGS